MASILGPQIKFEVNASIIDCNWYYGSLLSPRKCIDIDPYLGLGDAAAYVDDKDEITHHDIQAEEREKPEERSREEDNSSTECFGSNDFNSANICEENGDEEAECLANMFSVLDEDGDGRVTADEMMRFLHRLSLEMPKEEVDLAVRSVSASGDEFLTALEFAKFYRILLDKEEEVNHVEVEEQTICEAFGVFDQNGDGLISATELADVLSRLGHLEGIDVNCCQRMIKNVDFNGGGFVDIHEFRHLITRGVVATIN